MTLAEALSLRADLQKRIAQLESQILAVAKVADGDAPVEDPEKLLRELNENIKQLDSLVYRINATNFRTILDNGQNLTCVISRRDALKMQHNSYNKILLRLLQREDRYSRSEIKYVNTLDVKKVRDTINRLSKQLREVETLIQSTNWSTELSE